MKEHFDLAVTVIETQEGPRFLYEVASAPAPVIVPNLSSHNFSDGTQIKVIRDGDEITTDAKVEVIDFRNNGAVFKGLDEILGQVFCRTVILATDFNPGDIIEFSSLTSESLEILAEPIVE
jgi:hypothetical protein